MTEFDFYAVLVGGILIGGLTVGIAACVAVRSAIKEAFGRGLRL